MWGQYSGDVFRRGNIPYCRLAGPTKNSKHEEHVRHKVQTQHLVYSSNVLICKWPKCFFQRSYCLAVYYAAILMRIVIKTEENLKTTPCYEVTNKRSYITSTDTHYSAEPLMSYLMPISLQRKL